MPHASTASVGAQKSSIGCCSLRAASVPTPLTPKSSTPQHEPSKSGLPEFTSEVYFQAAQARPGGTSHGGSHLLSVQSIRARSQTLPEKEHQKNANQGIRHKKRNRRHRETNKEDTNVGQLKQPLNAKKTRKVGAQPNPSTDTNVCQCRSQALQEHLKMCSPKAHMSNQRALQHHWKSTHKALQQQGVSASQDHSKSFQAIQTTLTSRISRI